MSTSNNKAEISADQIQDQIQQQKKQAQMKINKKVGKLFIFSVLICTISILVFLTFAIKKSSQSLSQNISQNIGPSSQQIEQIELSPAVPDQKVDEKNIDSENQKLKISAQKNIIQLQQKLAKISQENELLKNNISQFNKLVQDKKAQINELNNLIEQNKNAKDRPIVTESKPNPLPMTKRVGKFTQKGAFRRSFPDNPQKLVFDPPFKLYFKHHLDFLQKNNVTSVTEIGCDEKCKQTYANQKNIKVKFANRILEENSADWVVLRQFGVEHNLVAAAKIAANSALKGVTIFLKNMEQLRNFNSRYRQFVFEVMKFHDLKYDEAASLNLRRQQARIPLIFSKNPKKSALQFPFKKPAKNYIAIQLVLKINENVPFLREWIGYHMHLGIDKFFIYDNNGTVGQPGWSNTTQNKYSFKFECLNMTEQKVIQEWESIWEDYYQHIIYVPWQYTDDQGNIIYGQVESQGDFSDYFQDVVSYVGFIDSDQMLFSSVKLDFATTLSQYSLKGYSSLRLCQKKFTSRFCKIKQKMMNINQTFILTNQRNQAQKSFFEMDNFCPWGSIHDALVYRKSQYVLSNTNQWRFNHYNLISPIIPYYQNRKKTTSTKMQIDSSGFQRYSSILNQICKGKCSQSFTNICDLAQFKCPQMNKVYPLQNGLKINENVKWW